MATEIQDVKSFWLTNKYLTREGFTKTHPDPFLIEIDPVDAETDLRSFETLASQGEREKDQFRKMGQIEPYSRIFRIEKKQGTSFPDKIAVGRAQNNDIIIAHPSVSKFHAYFTMSDIRLEFSVVDVNSKNGTLLNDLRITPLKKTEIKNSDRLSFGGEIKFMFLFAQDLYTRLKILEHIFKS